jgi:UDP-N-acetyl-D-mannosaminuronic acid dehydrogenase
MQRICVIGLGYIGLPTAATLANCGYLVHGYDISARAVNAVKQGKIHIVEPDLDKIVAKSVKAKRLQAARKPAEADIFIITVPTPVKGKENTPDLSYIFSAADAIAPYLAKNNLVILESTSPVGTTQKLTKYIQKKRPDLKNNLHVAYCPERVLPGKILYELTHNDRIVGGMTPKAGKLAHALYASITKGEVLITSAGVAEMVKLSENAFRDINIAYANELSLVADKLDVNIREVITLANHHPRVNILQPGPGVGGHCIAVDPWFLVHSAPAQSPLMRTARQVNDSKRDWVVKKAIKLSKKIPRAPRITCLGISFKPNIDDIRESPALYVVQQLRKKSTAKITVVEPLLSRCPPALKGVKFAQKLDADLLQKTDLLIALVKHSDFAKARKMIRGFTGEIIDTCGLLD